MISKNTPRQLDKSSDYRLIPNNAMVDALNLTIAESLDTGESGAGDVGVLKNILGNKEAAFVSHEKIGVSPSIQYKPVGACVDNRLGMQLYSFGRATRTTTGCSSMLPIRTCTTLSKTRT